MTAKALIEALSKLPPDTEIYRKHHKHDYFETKLALPIHFVGDLDCDRSDGDFSILDDSKAFNTPESDKIQVFVID
jgi:hypothetical protein